MMVVAMPGARGIKTFRPVGYAPAMAELAAMLQVIGKSMTPVAHRPGVQESRSPVNAGRRSTLCGTCGLKLALSL